jgi:hypothetical protein
MVLFGNGGAQGDAVQAGAVARIIGVPGPCRQPAKAARLAAASTLC